MPYNVAKDGNAFWVMKHGKKLNKKGYRTRAEALRYMRALYSHAPKSERAP